MTKIDPMKEAREALDLTKDLRSYLRALDPTREMLEALAASNTAKDFRETILGPNLTREMLEALAASNTTKDFRETILGPNLTREMLEALAASNTTKDFRETILGLNPTKETREVLEQQALAINTAKDFRATILDLDLTKKGREVLERHVLGISDFNQGTIAGGIANLDIQPVRVTSRHRPEEEAEQTVDPACEVDTALAVRPLRGPLIEASDVRNAPPNWAEGFLDFLLPRSKNDIIGDMAQDYHRKYLPRHGPRGAQWRFWFEALKEVAAAWLGR